MTVCLLILVATLAIGSLCHSERQANARPQLTCVNGPLQGMTLEIDEPRRGWYLFAQHGQHIYQSIDPWDGELEAEGWYCGPGASVDSACVGK